MTDEERKIALYCLKASSDYHSEVCEKCIRFPNCDHTGQDDVTETIIKELEQEGYYKDLARSYERTIVKLTDAIANNIAIDKIRADIIKYESDCRLSVDEYPLCKKCNDKVFKTIYGILDKYKAESEQSDDEERSS